MIYALGPLVGTYVCAMTGYALAKLSFPGKKAMLGFVLGGLMVPTTVLIIPIFIMEHDLRLTNTFAGVILPLIVSPFGRIFHVGVLRRRGVPVAHRFWKSGRRRGYPHLPQDRPADPGARPGYAFPHIVHRHLEQLLPSLVLLHQGSLFPLTVGLATILSLGQQGLGVSSYSALLLGAVISVLPMLVLFPFLQKYVPEV